MKIKKFLYILRLILERLTRTVSSLPTPNASLTLWIRETYTRAATSHYSHSSLVNGITTNGPIQRRPNQRHWMHT